MACPVDNMDSLEERIEKLELNQHRLALLTLNAPEHHKAFDRKCFEANLSFDQESRVREAILNFLGSERTGLSDMIDEVAKIVGDKAQAKELISGFKARRTALERWQEIDPDGLL